jgi:hypothetical protein
LQGECCFAGDNGFDGESCCFGGDDDFDGGDGGDGFDGDATTVRAGLAAAGEFAGGFAGDLAFFAGERVVGGVAGDLADASASNFAADLVSGALYGGEEGIGVGGFTGDFADDSASAFAADLGMGGFAGEASFCVSCC